jgi:hypothetical protein
VVAPRRILASVQSFLRSPTAWIGLSRTVAVSVALAIGCFFFLRAVDRSYPVEEWLVWRLLPIWGYTLLFNLACVASGAALLRAILPGKRFPPLELLVLGMATGVVLFVFGLYLLGFTCQFKAWGAIALPLVLLVAGRSGLREIGSALSRMREAPSVRSTAWRVVSTLAIGAGAVWIAFVYLGALDVTAFNFDASWYHYPTAQDYARTGCIVPFPGENQRAYPHLTSLLHTWALLVPGLKPLPLHWMLSLHLEYSIVLWRIAGVAAGMAWMLEGRRTPGLWAVFFLYPSIFIYDQNIGGSADHFLGFFAMPIVLATVRLLRAFDGRRAIVLGVVMGGHMLVKYQALYLLSAVTLVCAVRWIQLVAYPAFKKRKPPPGRARRLVVALALAVGTATLVTAPHFAKNTVFYGNPLYPFAQQVFSTTHPKHMPGVYKEAKRPKVFGPNIKGFERAGWAMKSLFDYSLTTRNRGLTERRPYMGALFSILLPCLLLVRRSRRIWLTAAVAIPAFLLWAYTGPNDRYLLSFYDLLIATSGALLVRVWELGIFSRFFVVGAVALQLIWGGDAMLYYADKELRSTIALVVSGYKKKYDEQRFNDQRHQRELADATPLDAKILARNYRDLLGLDRMVLSDNRIGQDYVNYARVKDTRQLWDMLHSRGITHLMYPEGSRRPWWWNNTILFNDLFRGAIDVKRFGNLVIGKMPPAAPAASTPYWVYCKGLRGYQDGLYRVEQLDLDDRSPNLVSPKPKPKTPLNRANESNLVAQARAVAIANGRTSGEIAELLRHDFEQVERFSDSSVYLRRLPGMPASRVRGSRPSVERAQTTKQDSPKRELDKVDDPVESVE